MKNLLPKRPGFTLIELLVVVAILAILSVIGYSIFSNAQATARDGIRRAEINNLGKSIESARDAVTSTYKYTDVNFASDYPQVKPKDPSASSAKPFYCVATSTAVNPAPIPSSNPISWTASQNCPTDAAGTGYTAWTTLVDNTSAYNTATANALQAGSVKYWKVCTRLEVSGAFVCQTQLQL